MPSCHITYSRINAAFVPCAMSCYSCPQMCDTSKTIVTPLWCPTLSSRIRSTSLRRRISQLSAKPLTDKASTTRRPLSDAFESASWRSRVDEETPLWTLQRYLDSLYAFPTVYELKVVETRDPSISTEPREKSETKPDDYYVNFGKAIETIKDDFPHLFHRDFDCIASISHSFSHISV